MNENQLRAALDFYLDNPAAGSGDRDEFIERECTFTDGSAGDRTADYILSKLGSLHG